MKKLNPQDIYQKFRNGDSLSDAEVNEGVDFFGKLAEDLSLCGPTFVLASNELMRVGRTLKDYQSARNENKNKSADDKSEELSFRHRPVNR